MKIAICLSGHMRNFRRTEHFWRPLLNLADIYISTWDGGDSRSGQINHAELDAFYHPKALVVDSFSQMHERFRAEMADSIEWASPIWNLFDSSRMIGFCSFYYKMWHCQSLLQQEYDIVIRSRCDVTVNVSPIDPLNSSIPASNAVITILRPTEKNWGGCSSPDRYVNDVFLVADQLTMNRVCNVYNNLPRLYEQARRLNDVEGYMNPHALLSEHLKLEAVEVKPFLSEFDIVR